MAGGSRANIIILSGARVGRGCFFCGGWSEKNCVTKVLQISDLLKNYVLQHKKVVKIFGGLVKKV